MKLRIARTLALGGVLASASAVVAYNPASGSAPDPDSASSSTVATTGSGSTANSAASSTPNSTPVTVAAVAVAGSPSQFSFVPGDAATLVLDTAGGTLRIVSYVPNPGWFTARLEQSTATALDVQLESASGQVQFSADLVNGSIVTELLTGAAPARAAPGNTAPDNTGNTAPGNTTAGNTTPGGDDDSGGDDNSGPGGGSDDD